MRLGREGSDERNVTSLRHYKSNQSLFLFRYRLAVGLHFIIYHMCTKGIRDRVSIDTLDRHLDRPSIDTRSTSRSILRGDSIDISVASRSQSTNFRRHAVECRSILAVITRSLLVDTQPTYRSLPYGRLSVACRSPGGDISV